MAPAENGLGRGVTQHGTAHTTEYSTYVVLCKEVKGSALFGAWWMPGYSFYSGVCSLISCCGLISSHSYLQQYCSRNDVFIPVDAVGPAPRPTESCLCVSRPRISSAVLLDPLVIATALFQRFSAHLAPIQKRPHVLPRYPVHLRSLNQCCRLRMGILLTRVAGQASSLMLFFTPMLMAPPGCGSDIAFADHARTGWTGG